ncbi:MAG TPA: hypothetical protein VGF38_13595, partial [Ktedonobacterales bacterium]
VKTAPERPPFAPLDRPRNLPTQVLSRFNVHLRMQVRGRMSFYGLQPAQPGFVAVGRSGAVLTASR